eukprot:TRINITY_DN3129_c0_g1_i2.p1 TRINITY_DN3129_c0_g1~~TRINITY_DN3129_c0_g1_i2.p1  ORF type:complete len:521 (+),score=126.80 TRINITY_DN3129_c0_g1_i2:1357-2919(+)
MSICLAARTTTDLFVLILMRMDEEAHSTLHIVDAKEPNSHYIRKVLCILRCCGHGVTDYSLASLLNALPVSLSSLLLAIESLTLRVSGIIMLMDQHVKKAVDQFYQLKDASQKDTAVCLEFRRQIMEFFLKKSEQERLILQEINEIVTQAEALNDLVSLEKILKNDYIFTELQKSDRFHLISLCRKISADFLENLAETFLKSTSSLLGASAEKTDYCGALASISEEMAYWSLSVRLRKLLMESKPTDTEDIDNRIFASLQLSSLLLSSARVGIKDATSSSPEVISAEKIAENVDHLQQAQQITLAEIFLSFGRYFRLVPDLDAALKFQRKAFDLRTKVFGKSHFLVAEVRQHIGFLLMTKESFVDAKEELEVAYSIQSKTLGEAHPLLCITKSSLGTVEMHLDNLSRAEKLTKEALRDLESSLGPSHTFTSFMQENHGRVLLKRGDRDGALTLFHKSYEIRLKTLGPSAHDTLLQKKLIDSLETQPRTTPAAPEPETSTSAAVVSATAPAAPGGACCRLQ